MGKSLLINRRTLLAKTGAMTGAAGIAALAASAPATAGITSIVGVWFVNAVGAPFQPHLFTFHADLTLITSNPDAGDPHTSDSDGMGPWVPQSPSVVVGAFEEINADRTTHLYVSRLRVEFQITLNGHTFTGPATANYYNPDGTFQQGPYPATLNGQRVALPAGA